MSAFGQPASIFTTDPPANEAGEYSPDVMASNSGRFMTDDGRVAFATPENLAAATDGIVDVYEYVGGRPQLIGAGHRRSGTRWPKIAFFYPGRSSGSSHSVATGGTSTSRPTTCSCRRIRTVRSSSSTTLARRRIRHRRVNCFPARRPTNATVKPASAAANPTGRAPARPTASTATPRPACRSARRSGGMATGSASGGTGTAGSRACAKRSHRSQAKWLSATMSKETETMATRSTADSSTALGAVLGKRPTMAGDRVHGLRRRGSRSSRTSYSNASTAQAGGHPDIS